MEQRRNERGSGNGEEMYKVVCGMENEETTSKVEKDERMDWWRDEKRREREREGKGEGELRQKGFGFIGRGSSFATMEGKHWRWEERGRRDATIGEGFAW